MSRPLVPAARRIACANGQSPTVLPSGPALTCNFRHVVVVTNVASSKAAIRGIRTTRNMLCWSSGVVWCKALRCAARPCSVENQARKSKDKMLDSDFIMAMKEEGKADRKAAKAAQMLALQDASKARKHERALMVMLMKGLKK
mmetsp:Transcript_22784/g.45703  ORF Transcript_22784/g.45703 Transcript_22784/m.45703 type:complete len:143 (-) Transcript_22784:254-682(-)